jgi:cytidyltransferase-like protein
MRLFANSVAHDLHQLCRTLVVEKIESEWWRHYHTMEHLDHMFEKFSNNPVTMSEIEQLSVIMAIAFHDAVYDPTKGDNESRSVEYMYERLEPWAEPGTPVVATMTRAAELIMSTAGLSRKTDASELAFQLLDCDLIINGSLDQLIRYEDQIFKEYQYVPHSIYKVERLKVLDRLIEVFPDAAHNLSFLKSYAGSKKPRVGLYVGSFNPYHVGHLDITRKAAELFDKVVIVQCVNPLKEESGFNVMNYLDLRFYERAVSKAFIKDIVSEYETMYDVVIVRGLRNGLDLTYEFDYNKWLADFGVTNQVVYIPANPDLAHLSSSSIRGLNGMKPEVAAKFIVK